MIGLFVAVFGGAIAWSLHLLVSYALIGLACRPAEPLLAPGTTLTALLVAVSIATLAAAAGSALVAARIWRHPTRVEHGAARSSDRGIAFVGLLLDVVFAITILTGASAIFILAPC